MGTKNKLVDLNNHLFEELERLNDEELKGEALQEERERAKTMATIAQIAQFENTATEEKDDAADAMRYYAESIQSGVTFTIDKASARRLHKMVGLETITRKRFKKLLMGCGLQRNDVEIIAEAFHNNKIRYTPLAVQNVIETIIKEAEKEEEM